MRGLLDLVVLPRDGVVVTFENWVIPETGVCVHGYVCVCACAKALLA